MSIRCKLGWHDWTKSGLPKTCYGQLSQFRECKRCGIVDSKKRIPRASRPRKKKRVNI